MERTLLLTPEERDVVIGMLFEFNLIKYDKGGKLPLAHGGTTDLYVNLRNARDDHEAMGFLSEVYVSMLKDRVPTRILEVPHAVTCFTQGICSDLRIPLVTMRTEVKANRVSGELIGTILKGDAIALVDDVITDGASKIPALKLCRERKATAALVVLVDREEGWQRVLEEAGFGDTEVFAGMILDHIRDYLRRYPEALQ